MRGSVESPPPAASGSPSVLLGPSVRRALLRFAGKDAGRGEGGGAGGAGGDGQTRGAGGGCRPSPAAGGGAEGPALHSTGEPRKHELAGLSARTHTSRFLNGEETRAPFCVSASPRWGPGCPHARSCAQDPASVRQRSQARPRSSAHLRRTRAGAPVGTGRGDATGERGESS